MGLQVGMLAPEELCGDNQYFCEYCNKKADATRQLCLQQLPPYLCLSLQRFVFDMKVLYPSCLSSVLAALALQLQACSNVIPFAQWQPRKPEIHFVRAPIRQLPYRSTMLCAVRGP